MKSTCSFCCHLKTVPSGSCLSSWGLFGKSFGVEDFCGGSARFSQAFLSKPSARRQKANGKKASKPGQEALLMRFGEGLEKDNKKFANFYCYFFHNSESFFTFVPSECVLFGDVRTLG
ncbi:MAG TPA: hypothetical protein H9828_07065 [Candidatus Alistipes intestinigallinarum]|uniref:Uncharacterized protein n=1 Tax=Candidatus Alistipes intestinigallinarum TaxID=2838440 RepID=A0A9D1Z102_9BACT|nr:hypothetical protein [Candidatus Alistipes intestinigallinarum]